MRVSQVVNTTVGASVVTSSVYVSRERPDQFGTVLLRHGGTKIASGFTGTIEGSIDNSTWVVLDTFKVADAEYATEVDAAAPLNSWTKVVPLAPYMRIRLVGGANNTFNGWIGE